MSEAQEEAVRVGRRVFVSNLAWRTSWQDLKDKFRECGTVVYTNVIRERTGRSKGWGIVEYETAEEAAKAIQTLDGIELGGRNINVREDREDRDLKEAYAADGTEPPARPPRRPKAESDPAAAGAGAAAAPRGESSGCQIVVHGLPYSYTWRELKDMFEGMGTIERADVVYGRDGRSRGYGTVKFATQEEAQAAIEAVNGKDVDGREIKVNIDKFA